LRFGPLRRLPDRWQPHTPGFTKPRSSCPLSVSHALRALLRLRSAGLVSCRSRPWGFFPRRSSPSAAPSGSLSDSLALLQLTTRLRLSHHPMLFCGSETARLPARDFAVRVRSSEQPCFRALLSAAVRLPASAVTLSAGSATSLGFLPPQGLSSAAAGLPRYPSSLELPWAFLFRDPPGCSPEYFGFTFGLSLASSATPLEVFSPPDPSLFFAGFRAPGFPLEAW
jgi:hypothetical protein